jgi:hypothetical protein
MRICAPETERWLDLPGCDCCEFGAGKFGERMECEAVENVEELVNQK